VFDAALIVGCESKKWQEGVEALEGIIAKIEGDEDGCGEYAKALIYFLRKTPSFKPVNFNVCKSVYLVCAALAKHAPEGKYTLVHTYT
jgi:hypothetical protein